MHQVASPRRRRTLHGEIVREMLHTLRDVRLDVMLLLSVLRAPVDVSLRDAAPFRIERQLVLSEAHRAGKRHRPHLVTPTANEHLWSGNEPRAAAFRGKKSHKHTRITTASPCEKRKGRHVLRGGKSGAAGKDNLAERPVTQLRMEILEVDGIALLFFGEVGIHKRCLRHRICWQLHRLPLHVEQQYGAIVRRGERGDYKAATPVEFGKRSQLLRLLSHHATKYLLGMRQTVINEVHLFQYN